MLKSREQWRPGSVHCRPPHSCRVQAQHQAQVVSTPMRLATGQGRGRPHMAILQASAISPTQSTWPVIPTFDPSSCQSALTYRLNSTLSSARAEPRGGNPNCPLSPFLLGQWDSLGPPGLHLCGMCPGCLPAPWRRYLGSPLSSPSFQSQSSDQGHQERDSPGNSGSLEVTHVILESVRK